MPKIPNLTRFIRSSTILATFRPFCGKVQTFYHTILFTMNNFKVAGSICQKNCLPTYKVSWGKNFQGYISYQNVTFSIYISLFFRCGGGGRFSSHTNVVNYTVFNVFDTYHISSRFYAKCTQIVRYSDHELPIFATVDRSVKLNQHSLKKSPY